MKYSNTPVNRFTQILSGLAALALLASSSGKACDFWDAPCHARKAAAALQTAANQALADARAAATKAAAAAKEAADAAAAKASYEAQVAKKAAARLAAAEAASALRLAVQQAGAAISAWNEAVAAGAAITTSEVNDIARMAQFSYGASLPELTKQYQQARTALTAIYDQVLQAIFRATGKAFLANQQPFLGALQHNLHNLDTEGSAALNRIALAISGKRGDDDTRADMLTLASKLGLSAGQPNSIVPDCVTDSSWGVMVGYSEALGAGVSATYGFMMSTSGEDCSIALTESLGGSLGVSVGGDAMIGITWAPGAIEDAGGASVGFGVSAAIGAGAGIGLSWNVSAGMSGAQYAIPGFTLSLLTGAEFSGAFEGGQTFLLGIF